MGTLADETYIQTFSLVFNDCTRDDINIKLSIDPITIDLTNGYLKNNAPSSLASKNITFQLLDEDEIPIDLTKKNIFNQLTKNSEAEFYFSLNYVKKDNNPPSTGEISSDIIINVEINNEIMKIED